MKAALNITNVRQICFDHSQTLNEPFPSPSARRRLAHKNDCLDKKLYPLLTHKHRVATQKCAVCHVFIGRCVTVCSASTASARSNRDYELNIRDSFQVVYYQ